MSDFSDLVKKLNAISNNEETVSATGDTIYKPVEEAVSGTRETVNILKVFNELEEAAKPDYIDLDGDAIARNEPLPQVNENSNYEIIMGFIDQWTEAGQPDDYMDDLVAYVKKTIPDSKDWNYAASLIKDGVESYQNREYGTSSLMGLRNNTESVEEAVAGGGDKEESMKKAAADKKAKKESVAEDKANEDVLGDIASRYRDFMKSEVAQGNDLTTVDSAVKEATSSATAIDDSFQKMFDMMGRLMKVTAEGSVLSKMVEREGGDAAWIADAFAKLNEAMEALEEAHMYSNPPREDD